MQIKFAFIKSKVAKRIFILFVITAIIPVTITGIVAYNHVTSLLVKQQHKHLTIESKSYGMSIFDRILVAESQLIALSENLLQSKSLAMDITAQYNEIDSSNTHFFKKIKIYSNDILFNSVNEKHLLDGNTKITVKNTYDKNFAIYFNRLLNTSDSTLLISAEVDKKYIFGDMDIFAGDEDACVIAKGIGALNCSNETMKMVSLPSFEKYFESQINTNTININDNNYIVSSWELFLNGYFNTESWIIYYTTPSSIILSSIKSFSNTLLPLLLLAILIVSLLSINQISKILVPLEKLSFLTKRISKRDFGEKVKFDSGDEFEQLGESFNTMSYELGRQFTVMTAMSNLDRAILTKMNKTSVVEAIFKNLKDYLEYSYASVILLEKDNSNGTLYIYNKTNNNISSEILINIEEKIVSKLLDNKSSSVRTLERNKLNTIEWLDTIHSNYITTIAIKQKQVTSALIVIGHQYIPKLNEEGIKQLDNYTDRVSVALNAIEREEKLVKQANYDDLTGLPNRQLLIDTFYRMSQQPNSNQKLAVLFIDLDRFKIINDSQGHAIGDKLLIEASDRIQSCLNKSAFLGRYGGDEFVILFPYGFDSSDITDISKNIINLLSKLFTIENYEQSIGASIGIAIYPQDGKTWNEVLQKADIAMYKAKQKGRGKLLYFSDTMQAEIYEKATLEADLFHAIDKQEITMVYQPQINIATGEISGAETLMRWKHTTKGNIRPDQFISYAEDTGFIIPLGIWAIRTALKQCSDWQLENHALPKISINISPRQIRHENFINEIEALIVDFDMHTTNIEFEITESLFLNDDLTILNKLQHLNKLGISISIDDFGKGYSSLSYLKHLPVQTLKLDKLFIDDIHKEKESIAIVKAIIEMAKSLNKKVVAEGIETVEQLSILKDLGCDIAQGYYISKPKPANEVLNYTKTTVISLNDFRENTLNS
ncbi:MAG: EAL domain-containing protein [Gammaproteobacteria bacterium]